MEKKKVLIITQEMEPYTNVSIISKVVQNLPKYIQDHGSEIRVLMPRFGSINERRHRLHEVVRLSGINIIVDDDDYPLIIKVASLPGARIQVYFLDNDEFFKRKFVFENSKGKAYSDNSDRMIFFCKGVVETVKKFGWPPDIIHCHGPMTSLLPAYLRKAYKNEPLFANSKIVYSLYDNELPGKFGNDFFEKAAINQLEVEDLKCFGEGKDINLHKGAVMHADAIIKASESYSEKIEAIFENLDKPVLEYTGIADETFLPATTGFYDSLMVESEPEVEKN